MPTFDYCIGVRINNVLGGESYKIMSREWCTETYGVLGMRWVVEGLFICLGRGCN